MIIDYFPEFLSVVGDNSRLLGLDIGTKTIGVAVCDGRHKIASPLTTIKTTRFGKDLVKLRNIISEQDAKGLVIGLPLNTDGSEGAKCQSVRQFGRNILKVFEIPITFCDERFSTVAVTDILLEADVSRQKRTNIVDKLAAAYILQCALDKFENI